MRVVVTHTLAYHATNADVSIIRSSDLLKEMRSKLRKIVERLIMKPRILSINENKYYENKNDIRNEAKLIVSSHYKIK